MGFWENNKLGYNIVRILLSITGINGNLLVILVIRKIRPMRPVTKYYITSLAVADLLASVFFLPYPYGEVPSGIGGEILCRLWYSDAILYYFFAASTYNLVLVTLERYWAIIYPVKHLTMFTEQKAKLSLTLLWILTLILEFFTVFLNDYQDGVCILEWPTGAALILLGIWIFLSEYALPLVIMFVAYYRILRYLRERNRSMQNGSQNGIASAFVRAKVHVVKMLYVVTVLFGLLWAPNHITHLLFTFGVQNPYEEAREVVILIGFCNSCVNPFVYGFSNPLFRKTLKRMVSCVSLKSPSVEPGRTQNGQQNQQHPRVSRISENAQEMSML
ncbi:galanin receptor 2a-like [Saccoglossus kowalevskii]|uniref:Pyroglutamylated RFamide peptide receptor-like n=1 Tax=Saccoglossus kowalevskii TaxID=10224 RepID=A0ABM0M4M1_SACKO|nr:PREDICTED: pyroglutamylated RFamide peptide receptor-like [Saccoglossus kowalevskii]